MKKELVIFDFDGTIVDSIPYWANTGRNYLLSKGITPKDTLEDDIEGMTLEESADYFRIEYQVEGTNEQIIEESLQNMKKMYEFMIPPKPGMKEEVRKLKEDGKEIVLVTMSEMSCVKLALKRIGLLSYFDAIYTSNELLGLSKRGPEIYEKVCQMHQTTPEATTVYEDVDYAIRSAKEAGCKVIAVYDQDMHDKWDEIALIADEVRK